MRRLILTIWGTALLVTAISADAFAQRGRASNDNGNGRGNSYANGNTDFAERGRGRNDNGRGNSHANGNTGGGNVSAAPEIAVASGASALALLAGGLLVLRGRRRH